MAELIPKQLLGNEGHFPNTESTIVELHRLLSTFLASKHFAELCTNYPGEGFDPICKIQEVEGDEITRVLLNLAITARVIDDREDGIFCLFGADCGSLQRDITAPDVVSLSLREACNKIIHANKVRFDVEELGAQQYFNPIIYLYGNLHGKEWRVQLNVIDFCKAYVSTVCHF
jgi:hypothetical protein